MAVPHSLFMTEVAVNSSGPVNGLMMAPNASPE
jgi:hypothetical protein